MKTKIQQRINIVYSLLILGIFMVCPLLSIGQDDDPSIPIPPDCPPNGAAKAGSGASIADGIFILSSLAFTYGLFKYVKQQKDTNEDEMGDSIHACD